MIKKAKSTGDAIRVVKRHREEPLERAATAARAEFFELLEQVVVNPDIVVYIDHRHLPQRGVLVGEGYLEYVRDLERLVADLLRQKAGDEPFKLCGTATLHGDVEGAIAALRAGDAEESNRFRDL